MYINLFRYIVRDGVFPVYKGDTEYIIVRREDDTFILIDIKNSYKVEELKNLLKVIPSDLDNAIFPRKGVKRLDWCECPTIGFTKDDYCLYYDVDNKFLLAKFILNSLTEDKSTIKIVSTETSVIVESWRLCKLNAVDVNQFREYLKLSGNEVQF